MAARNLATVATTISVAEEEDSSSHRFVSSTALSTDLQPVKARKVAIPTHLKVATIEAISALVELAVWPAEPSTSFRARTQIWAHPVAVSPTEEAEALPSAATEAWVVATHTVTQAVVEAGARTTNLL